MVPTPDSIQEKAVLDAIEDLSDDLVVEVDVVISSRGNREGDGNGNGNEAEAEASTSPESICQGLLHSKSINEEKEDRNQNASPDGQQQQVLASAPPNVIINTDSRSCQAVREVSSKMGIPVVSVTDDDPRDSSLKVPCSQTWQCAVNPDEAGSKETILPPPELDINSLNKGIVMVKSPDRILMESVRDTVQHFDLASNFLRVLYDREYGKKMEREEE